MCRMVMAFMITMVMDATEFEEFNTFGQINHLEIRSTGFQRGDEVGFKRHSDSKIDSGLIDAGNLFRSG